MKADVVEAKQVVLQFALGGASDRYFEAVGCHALLPRHL